MSYGKKKIIYHLKYYTAWEKSRKSRNVHKTQRKMAPFFQVKRVPCGWSCSNRSWASPWQVLREGSIVHVDGVTCKDQAQLGKKIPPGRSLCPGWEIDLNLHSQGTAHVFSHAYLASMRISFSRVKCLLCVLCLFFSLDFFKDTTVAFRGFFTPSGRVCGLHVFSSLGLCPWLCHPLQMVFHRALVFNFAASNVSISFYGSRFWCEVFKISLPGPRSPIFLLSFFPL